MQPHSHSHLYDNIYNVLLQVMWVVVWGTCLQAGVCYPGGIVGTRSANLPLFVPPFYFLFSSPLSLPSPPSCLIPSHPLLLPNFHSSHHLITNPSSSFHPQCQETNEALINDEGVLSCDHKGYICEEAWEKGPRKFKGQLSPW